jgi:hypothetical protein
MPEIKIDSSDLLQSIIDRIVMWNNEMRMKSIIDNW